MQRYILTIRYVTPSGKASEYTETGVYFPLPRDHVREALEWLKGGRHRRKVGRVLSHSYEVYEPR